MSGLADVNLGDSGIPGFDKDPSTRTIKIQGAADYGRSPTGAIDARDAAWGQQKNNDADQAATQQGMTDAYGKMTGSQTRGPMSREDAGLAQNETNSRYGDQNGAIGLAGSMAAGQMPSQGAYQLQRGLDQGLAQQTSMGRSARGAAGLSTAESNAGYNSANLQQNAFTAGGQLRAQDMATGRGLYGSMTTQQRQQDQDRLAQGNAMSQGNAKRNDSYGLAMGSLGNQFGELGNAQDNTDYGYYQQGMGPINDQFQANQMAQSWNSGVQRQAFAENSEEHA